MLLFYLRFIGINRALLMIRVCVATRLVWNRVDGYQLESKCKYCINGINDESILLQMSLLHFFFFFLLCLISFNFSKSRA